MFRTDTDFLKHTIINLKYGRFFLNLSLPFQEYGGSMPYKDVII
jgi:hypothetical protein